MYLYVTDALKIMVNVKGSNEVICQSNTHDKDADGQGTVSSEHRQVCAHLAASVLPPSLSCLFSRGMPVSVQCPVDSGLNIFLPVSVVAEVTHLSHIDSYPGAALQTL